MHNITIVLGIMFMILFSSNADEFNGATFYLRIQTRPPDYTVAEVWKNHKHLPTFERVRKLATDTFEFLPTEYDKRYKNPCWEYEGKFKCLPYFQILGVSKCGTTDLYHRLTLHEEMVDCRWKGPHFWDEQSYPSRRQNAKYDGSFQAYVSIFDKAAEHIKDHPRDITGEASSNTFTGVKSFLRGFKPRHVLQNATLAHYLYEATPFGRYIVMFRDPVERYLSAYHYYRVRKVEGAGDSEDFHNRAVVDIADWKRCVASGSEEKCAAIYQPQQLVKGMYALFVEDWISVFGHTRFMFIRNEDYLAYPVEHLEAVIKFLGMSEMTEAVRRQMLGMKRANVQKKSIMKNETRAMLREFYKPYNERLASLLDSVRWRWSD